MTVKRNAGDSMIWANLVHIGYNMWSDRELPPNVKYAIPNMAGNIGAKPFLRCDDNVWNAVLQRMADAGMNMVLMDLGDGIRYKSHPEIAVSGAWSIARLRKELDKIRALGMEPIPKLNFSTAHDTWLGPYSRCVSTPLYYKVCADLIKEVVDVFGKPRFFHLGYDEETPGHQLHYNYVVVRQHELWWNDFLFFVGQVEKRGVRAWIWSDYVWNHPEEFFKKMPKSVLQSNWYYEKSMSKKIGWVKAYLDLEAHGYDQVPTASNWSCPENFNNTVNFCSKNIKPPRLKGFLQAPWVPTLPCFLDRHLAAIERVEKSIRKKTAG